MAVISSSFELYKQFKEEAERIGWIYKEEFTPFEEKSMSDHNCLYFCSEWSLKSEFDPKFALSNNDGKDESVSVFYLESRWDSAFYEMKKIYELNDTKSIKDSGSIVELTIEEIANRFGIAPSQLRIKL